MDLFNKLKGSVTNALPGNPASREFDIHRHCASGGPGLVWKIYDGVKKTTKQEVSVFVFEKKQLEKYQKQDRDPLLDVLKKGVSQLTRLRHPKILSVLHPLEESRDSLTFATEPVFASLANILGHHYNLPSSTPVFIKDHELYEVEIKYGILQVTEGLSFLHNDVKMVHRNICPESLILNKNGAWKIAGFDFSLSNQSIGNDLPSYPFVEWSPEVPPVAQPCLDYMAPENALTRTCDTSSDMYSLAILLYAVFNKGLPLFQSDNQWSIFKRNADVLKTLRVSALSNLPEEVREHVKLLLNAEPALRPDAHQMTKIQFFEDVGAVTLQYLDSLFQEDNLRKSQFFKGLPQVVVKMPKRVNLQRVLPCLYKECVNPDMVPFVLPNILQIAEQATKEEYKQQIFPGLVPLFKLKEPVQILLIFMQNMNLLMSRTAAEDIKCYLLPMMFSALEGDTPKIQDLVLNILPSIAHLIEYTSLKNAVMPRIKKLCLTTGSLGVRVNCLLSVGKLLEFMDKWYVLDDVLPIVHQIPSREPGVLMSILGIYKVALSHKRLGITKEILANKVLPFLIPLSIDNSLNLEQYSAFSAVIGEMVKKVESEHRTKLQQLNSIQQEQKTIHFDSVHDSKSLVHGVEQPQESMMDKFLSTFGMSSSSSKEGGDKQVSDEKVSNVKPIGRPQTSLSLEEKQRLAKQQEQQQQFKSQVPLNPKTGANASNMKTSMQTSHKQPVKDLTSSLLSTGLSVPSHQAVGGTIQNNMGQNWSKQNTGIMSSSNNTLSSGFDSLLMFPSSSTMNSGSRSMQTANAGQGMASFPTPGVGSVGNMSRTSASHSSSGSRSMGQSYPTGSPSMMGNRPGMMGSQASMMGRGSGIMGHQTGIMGNPRGMMGNPASSMYGQTGMGNPTGIMGNPTGTMGNQPMGFMSTNQNTTKSLHGGMTGNSGMLTPLMPDQQTSSTLSKNDIDDLLG